MLNVANDGSHVTFVVTPPTRLPIPAIGKGKVVKVMLSSGGSVELSANDFGSTKGMPIGD